MPRLFPAPALDTQALVNESMGLEAATRPTSDSEGLLKGLSLFSDSRSGSILLEVMEGAYYLEVMELKYYNCAP